MVDAQIGRVLEALRDSGLEEETVVVFTSDHGDLDASHRLEHKSVPYEEAARVPFIVSQKGVTEAAAVDDEHLVSVGLDLMPTLCDYAGVDPPEGLPGASVRPLAEGRTVPAWREFVVTETRAGRMVRTARYKYILYESGARREQLIDLENDPGEMLNLAGDPAHRDVLARHRALLRAWIDETDDGIGRGYLP
jgi:arylsulfatase A-like enzyme